MKNARYHLKVIVLLTVFGFINHNISGQSYGTADSTGKSRSFIWPEGKKMALSLTFDDARISQADTGIPLLDKYGVKATFYVSPENMIRKPDRWRMAVLNGHEIGNHSLLHPCSGNFNWSRNRALEDYTLQKMMTELDSANMLIEQLIGVHPVSFAYPCGQTFVGRGVNVQSYIPLISIMFESGRGWLNEAPNDPAFCDLSQLNGTELDGKSSEEAVRFIEAAKAGNYWLILAGHEMNEEGYQTSQLKTIEAICKYATDPANGIWIDNIHKISSYIKNQRHD